MVLVKIKLEEGIDPSITQSALAIQSASNIPPPHSSDDELLEWLAATEGITCYGITVQQPCGKPEPDGRFSRSIQISKSTKASQSSEQMSPRKFLPIMAEVKPSLVATSSQGSSVRGYLAATQKYPSIALVVRETGGFRNTVKKVLNDLKSNQSASVVGSNAAETLLHVQLEDMKSLDKVRSDQSTSVLESDGAEALLHRIDNESWNSLDELKIEGLASADESDAADALLDCMETEDIKSPETLESAQSASVLELDAPEGGGLNKGYISNLADIISEKGSQDVSDQDFLLFLEQATSKENAAKKTGPLISLLQQAASGSSRRVHLSPWKGIENDLSWDSTLRSIMPSSINKNQEPICDNSSRGTLSTSPEAGTNLSSTRSSLLKMFTEIEENASGTCKIQYGVKLVAKIRTSVLLKFTSANLIAELKGISKVFSQLQNKVDRVHVKNVPIHAIVYFKTKKGMMDALKLKTLVIQGEILSLESITGAVVEEKSSQDPDTAILCSKTSTSERVQAPYLPAEENSSSDFRVEATDLRNRSHDMWSFDFLQNTIMIERYPKELSKKHIYDFFGVFGTLQMFYNNESIFVKFQNENDKDKALKVHKFVLDQYCFRINADVPPDELIVQLVSNGKTDTDQKKAMKAFSKYGAVSYIEYDKLGLLSAHYENSEKKRLKEILAGATEPLAVGFVGALTAFAVFLMWRGWAAAYTGAGDNGGAAGIWRWRSRNSLQQQHFRLQQQLQCGAGSSQSACRSAWGWRRRRSSRSSRPAWAGGIRVGQQVPRWGQLQLLA
ncbi:hypothetical protein L7F22_065142 [Adiantum nelumboides]|nr:hypothetical protein [Adiantum nelumboides]